MSVCTRVAHARIVENNIIDKVWPKLNATKIILLIINRIPLLRNIPLFDYT